MSPPRVPVHLQLSKTSKRLEKGSKSVGDSDGGRWDGLTHCRISVQSRNAEGLRLTAAYR